ncbi:hypothetical protein OEZ86_007520 [Tetradesmus obliquus]|nr:hypothetical protein OEZ86_007520 [Tetradesmus obliquus]
MPARSVAPGQPTQHLPVAAMQCHSAAGASQCTASRLFWTPKSSRSNSSSASKQQRQQQQQGQAEAGSST